MSESMNLLWLRVETEFLPIFRKEAKPYQGLWLVWHSESGEIETDWLSPDQLELDQTLPEALKVNVSSEATDHWFPVVCLAGDVAQLRWYATCAADGLAQFREKTKGAIAERLATLSRSQKPWMGTQ